jgi:hypothetical protein
MMTEPVWVSVRRKGIEYHALPDDGTQLTGCGRSTRTGEVVERANAPDSSAIRVNVARSECSGFRERPPSPTFAMPASMAASSTSFRR